SSSSSPLLIINQSAKGYVLRGQAHSAPGAIAITHSSQSICTSGNHVGSRKFIAFANGGLRKLRSVPGLWTLISDLGMSQRDTFRYSPDYRQLAKRRLPP